MYYVYVLRSAKSDLLYIGFSTDPVKRLKEHNSGLSSHTKKYRPWKLVYFEGYAHEVDARDREKKLKQFGKVYGQLKRRIAHSLEVL